MILYKKDYQAWMHVKSKIHNSNLSSDHLISYREGDVFWMSIGENIGYEEDGKGELFLRPVLVLSGISRTLFLGVPLSSQRKMGKFYIELHLPKRDKPSTVLFSQVRTYDTARAVGQRFCSISLPVLYRMKQYYKSIL